MGKTRLTENQKQEFIEAYLRHREDGKTKVLAAYRAARLELAAECKPSPGFATFRSWLRYGPKESETADVSAEAAEESSEETADVSAEADEANNLREENQILRRYLRIALAFADNADLTYLVDRAMPDLLPGE